MSEEKVQEGMQNPKSNFSEWFTEVVVKGELADIRYNIKGFLVFRPWSVLAMKQMYRLYEAELEKTGHLPAWFPAVIPEENFKKEAEHIEGFAPELFWITHAGEDRLEERMALRPTSETAMYTMYSKWIRSWRDLPLKIYQSCQVWRCETKATRPFIRSREFHWIEAHDAFETLDEAQEQVKSDMQTTEKIMHMEFGIPFISFRRPEWDKFAGAVHTYTADTLMPDGKALQQPSTHLLGQNFAKSFGVTFKDRKEKDKHVWQTCYGPAISRIFASVVGMHGDDKGLMFPFGIAPFQAVIIPIGKAADLKAVLKKCREVEKELSCAGIRVMVDDSENTPGWKFNQWEMKGVPIRIEIGPRDIKEKKAVLVRRDTHEKQFVSEKSICEAVIMEGGLLTENLRRRADRWFSGMVTDASTMEELGKKLSKGGFVRVNFCSDMAEGKPCADEIKDRFHAEVRGTREGVTEKPTGKCVVCAKKASVVVHVAKQY